MRKLLAAKERHQKRLFGIPGVVSVGVGHKTTGNISTAQLAIIVGVVEKLPEAKLSRRHIIPRFLDDIPTDVVQVGRIRLGGNSLQLYRHSGRAFICAPTNYNTIFKWSRGK